MHHLLIDIGIALAAAASLGLIAYWTKQPVLIGYLLAGVLVGPQMGLSLIERAESIEIISEIGLVLLLFVIGLEMNIRELFKSGRQLVLAGILQFPLCVVVGWGVFMLLGYRGEGAHFDAFYLAVAAGLSSTAIVVKLLYDKREMGTLPGRLTLGVLVFQDIFAILVLGLQSNISNPSIEPLLRALGATLILFVTAYIVSRYILSIIFKTVAHAPELVLTVAIGWCAALAITAQFLGVSKEMGALVAGVAMASFPYSLHITAKTVPIRDFFITLFFVALGMKIPPLQTVLIPSIIGVSVVVILSRFFTVYPIVAFAGGGRRVAFVSSLNLAQMSEFSLVIAALGVKFGHIGESTLAVIIYSMAILAAVSSYSIRFNHELYLVWNTVVGKFWSEEKALNREVPVVPDSCDVALLGCHSIGRALLDELARQGSAILSRIVIVDFNPEMLRAIRKRGITARFGDIGSLDTLEHAHVGSARVVMSTIPDMLLRGVTNLALVKMSRALAPTAWIVATADDSQHEHQLKAAGADIVIRPFDLAGEDIARQLSAAVAKL